MRRALLLVLFVLTATACGSGDRASQQSEHDIVGGEATGAFPAVGAITYYGGTICTGTLVAPRKVLTAAHCLDDVPASSLVFTLGPRIDMPTEVIPVERGIAHPAYEPAILQNDIAYLVLAWTPETVAPMDRVASLDSAYLGRDLVFVGYGYDDGVGQGGSGIKRAVSIPMSTLGPQSFTYATPGKNTCNGDSGGPAFAIVDGTYAVAGVTSGGDEHCLDYGYNMRVDAYVDFLALDDTPAPEPEPEPACGGETYEGRCDGDTLIWCAEGQVAVSDCAEMGMPCGYAPSLGIYGCLAPPTRDP